MPTPVDLVTDLPADFEVFGQAVDTSLADLKGGTSGQILAKNSNTDMDFVWIANDQGDITAVTAGTGITGGGTSGAVTITNDMATTITTNGDLLYGTGSGTYTRRGIGSTGQVLTVSGGVPTWSTPAGGGGKVLQVVQDTLTSTFTNSTSTFTDVGLTVSITPSSASSKIMVFLSTPFVYSTNGTSIVSNYSNVAVLRDATVIQSSSLGTYQYASTSNPQFLSGWSVVYLDSPATTSSVTYKMQAATAESTSVVVSASATNISSIVVMEIGA